MSLGIDLNKADRKVFFPLTLEMYLIIYFNVSDEKIRVKLRKFTKLTDTFLTVILKNKTRLLQNSELETR